MYGTLKAKGQTFKIDFSHCMYLNFVIEHLLDEFNETIDQMQTHWQISGTIPIVSAFLFTHEDTNNYDETVL